MSGVPNGASPAVCTKHGDPTTGGWRALPANQGNSRLRADHNNYLNCASFRHGTDGSFNARKERFAACHLFMLDDIGTKVAHEQLAGFEPTWLIETSPGNFQAGLVLDEPLLKADEAAALLQALINAGLCDPGSAGAASRWARLPQGVNAKRKYLDDFGRPFRCRLASWNPARRFTTTQIIERFNLTVAGPATSAKRSPTARVKDAQQVLLPGKEENPTITALKAHDLYKAPLGQGKHDISCPWVNEHTDAHDGGTVYFEPSAEFPYGGFCCQHSHGGDLHIGELLKHLGVSKRDAQNLDEIYIVNGELDAVVDAAEAKLAQGGNLFQSGGIIARIKTDPVTGDPAISPLSNPALTRELSRITGWQKFDGRLGDWVATDPPHRHVQVLLEGQAYRHLPVLQGVARQPFYREADGVLVSQPGYDHASQRFGVFDSRQFQMGVPTLEGAHALWPSSRSCWPSFISSESMMKPQLSRQSSRPCCALPSRLLLRFTFVRRPTGAGRPICAKSNPALTDGERERFVKALMDARRKLRGKRPPEDRAKAKAAVDAAKRSLGERGPVWWTDGSPDYNRRMARNTPYAEWYERIANRTSDS
ncbi:hypothetical protein RFUL19S_04990 [Rhizobacter fulvus]